MLQWQAVTLELHVQSFWTDNQTSLENKKISYRGQHNFWRAILSRFQDSKEMWQSRIRQIFGVSNSLLIMTHSIYTHSASIPKIPSWLLSVLEQTSKNLQFLLARHCNDAELCLHSTQSHMKARLLPMGLSDIHKIQEISLPSFVSDDGTHTDFLSVTPYQNPGFLSSAHLVQCSLNRSNDRILVQFSPRQNTKFWFSCPLNHDSTPKAWQQGQ